MKPGDTMHAVSPPCGLPIPFRTRHDAEAHLRDIKDRADGCELVTFVVTEVLPATLALRGLTDVGP